MSDQKNQVTNVSSMSGRREVTRRLRECETLDEAFHSSEFRQRVEDSLPKHLHADRMLRTFASAVQRTPLLKEASVASFVGACLTASQVGLEPNTPLGHLWLIPFKSRGKVNINIIFGYPGLLDLSFRTGLVRSVHADVVWQDDEFSFEYGTNAHLRHRPRPHKETDTLLYAYMHAQLRDGQAFEVIPYDAVLDIRNKSQAYRFALSKKLEADDKKERPPPAWTEAPWVRFEVAMARKTAFRAGSKWLPRSVELASAVALDEAQDRRQSIDFGSVLDAPTIEHEPGRSHPDYLGAAVDLAQEPADAGSAFGMRQSEPEPKRREPEPEGREDAVEFEFVLINEFGEKAKTYTDPVMFARDLAAGCDGLSDMAKENVLTYNAGAIAEASKVPDAFRVLIGLEHPDAVQERDEEAQSTERDLTIIPPDDRGGPNWSAWARAIKAGIGGVPAERLDAFAEGQRGMLPRAPIVHRVAAIRSIADAFTRKGMQAPAWLGEVMAGPA